MNRFTENDWFGFAGASKFSDGREPLIGKCRLEDGRFATVIFSGPESANLNDWNVELNADTGHNEMELPVYAFRGAEGIAVLARIMANEPVKVDTEHLIAGVE